jgi:hypothetical protein
MRYGAMKLLAAMAAGLLAGCATSGNPEPEAEKAAAAPASGSQKSVFSTVGLCKESNRTMGSSLSSSTGIGGRQATGMGACGGPATSQAKKLALEQPGGGELEQKRRQPFLEQADASTGQGGSEDDNDPY